MYYLPYYPLALSNKVIYTLQMTCGEARTVSGLSNCRDYFCNAEVSNKYDLLPVLAYTIEVFC